MEQIIINIMRQLAEDMPDISLIDEDYGQLETDEDTYPVTFPCLLVGNLNIDWSDTKSGQRGVAGMRLLSRYVYRVITGR